MQWVRNGSLHDECSEYGMGHCMMNAVMGHCMNAVGTLVTDDECSEYGIGHCMMNAVSTEWVTA